MELSDPFQLLAAIAGDQGFLERLIDAIIAEFPAFIAEYFWQLIALIIVLLLSVATVQNWRVENQYLHRVRRWTHENSPLPAGHKIVVPSFKPHETREDRAIVVDSPQGELEIHWKGLPFSVRLQRHYQIGKWDKLPVDSCHIFCPDTGQTEYFCWVFGLNGNVLHIMAKDSENTVRWVSNYKIPEAVK
jgi:hypothetical protein